MARIRLQIENLPAWSDDDAVVVLIGTEDAASLAASTPAGGTVAKKTTVADAVYALDTQQLRVEIDYTPGPGGKCAALPIGVAIEDPEGNRSAFMEDLIHLRDPPLGVARPTATATANVNEALIAWELSTDIG